ncbi:hypothetical protein BGX29_001877 [Mortierella sp. GBA35]|nr:hypothetical protein BGX29_001877 [Mortierella sp. GBA35]
MTRPKPNVSIGGHGSIVVVSSSFGMDLDITNNGHAAEQPTNNTQQETIPPQEPKPAKKEQIEFQLFKQYTEFMIGYDDVAGTTSADKIKSLHQVIAQEVSPIGTPVARERKIGESTEKFLVVRVGNKTNEDHMAMLQYRNDTQDPPKVTPFRRYMETHQQTESRQVDVRSLRGDTTIKDITGAFSPFGNVERVRIWLKRRNLPTSNIAATVYLESEESVKAMAAADVTTVYVGSEDGRITRLGTKPVVYPQELNMKITNLPPGTPAIQLKELYEEYGGCVVTILYSIATKRYSREAFVFFVSKEAQEKIIAKDLNINGVVAKWVKVDMKCCHHCGDTDRLVAACKWAKRKGKERSMKAAAGQTTNVNKYQGAVPKAVTTFKIDDKNGKTYSKVVTPGSQQDKASQEPKSGKEKVIGHTQDAYGNTQYILSPIIGSQEVNSQPPMSPLDGDSQATNSQYYSMGSSGGNTSFSQAGQHFDYSGGNADQNTHQ